MKVKFEAWLNMLRVTEYDDSMAVLKIESFSIHSFKIESVSTKLSVNGSTNLGLMRYSEEWDNYLDAADLPYASQASAESTIAALIMPLVNYANGAGSGGGGGGDASAANQVIGNDFLQAIVANTLNKANSSGTSLCYRANSDDDINIPSEYSTNDYLIRTTNHNYKFDGVSFIVDSITTTWINLATGLQLTSEPPNGYLDLFDAVDYNTAFSLKYIIATNTDAGLRWTAGDLLEMRFYDILANGGFIAPPYTLYRNLTTNSPTYFGVSTIDEITFEPAETRASNSLTFLEKLQLEEKSLCGSIVVANSPSSGDTTTYFNYSSQYITSGSFDTSLAESAIMRLIEFADGSVEMKFADGERFLYNKVFDNHLTFTY